jgi:hypothetical protein
VDIATPVADMAIISVVDTATISFGHEGE